MSIHPQYARLMEMKLKNKPPQDLTECVKRYPKNKPCSWGGFYPYPSSDLIDMKYGVDNKIKKEIESENTTRVDWEKEFDSKYRCQITVNLLNNLFPNQKHECNSLIGLENSYYIDTTNR